MPRPLTGRERDVLDHLLSADFAGVTELRHQSVSVLAKGEGMIIELHPSADCARAEVASRTPVEASVHGDAYEGGVILFVDDGFLSALEYWWVTEQRPELMPPADVIGPPVTQGESALRGMSARKRTTRHEGADGTRRGESARLRSTA